MDYPSSCRRRDRRIDQLAQRQRSQREWRIRVKARAKSAATKMVSSQEQIDGYEPPFCQPQSTVTTRSQQVHATNEHYDRACLKIPRFGRVLQRRRVGTLTVPSTGKLLRSRMSCSCQDHGADATKRQVNATNEHHVKIPRAGQARQRRRMGAIGSLSLSTGNLLRCRSGCWQDHGGQTQLTPRCRRGAIGLRLQESRTCVFIVCR
jgi:hypothetical protein